MHVYLHEVFYFFIGNTSELIKLISISSGFTVDVACLLVYDIDCFELLMVIFV